MEEDIKILKELIKYYKEQEDKSLQWHRYTFSKERQAIENILNRLEQLEKENEDLSTTCKEQSELIEDTYINYNDLEFTRLKRINKELEKENKELKQSLNATEKAGEELAHDLLWESIPKSVIREKIEELNNQYRDYNEKWEKSGMNKEHPFYKYLIRIEAEIDILEELLGDEQ